MDAGAGPDADFTLRSIELRDPILHRCHVIQTLDDGHGSGKLLVELDPPAPGHVYGRATDVDRVVLAPRHKGAALVPSVSEWPCHVHVCVPRGGGTWDSGPFEVLDWAVIDREAESRGTAL